jgi:branched-chain amino acid transport system permease protein
MHLLLESILDGVMNGAVFAILALTFGLIYYVTKVFHIAYGAIGTAGAYIAVSVAGTNSSLVALVGGTIIGMLAAVVLTAATCRIVYEPLERRGADAGITFVASLGLALLIEAGVELVFGPDNRSFSVAAFTQNRDVLGFGLSPFNGVELGLAVAIVIGASTLLNHTRVGFHIRALASNREQAELVGIRVGTAALMTCAVVGGLSVVAFVLHGMAGSVVATAGEQLTLYGVLAALAGGVASPVRNAIAGWGIGLISTVCAAYMPGQWAVVVVFVVALVLILVRPRGVVATAGANA